MLSLMCGSITTQSVTVQQLILSQVAQAMVLRTKMLNDRLLLYQPVLCTDRCVECMLKGGHLQQAGVKSSRRLPCLAQAASCPA